MISKELLEAISVLDTVENIHERTASSIDIGTDVPPYSHMANVYEVAHACKVWALTKCDSVISTYWNKDINKFVSLIMENWLEDNYSFEASSEPEAVFKAAQWIYDETRS